MKKVTIIVSILLSMSGCTKDEPKPDAECAKIDCNSVVALYPKGASVADQYIAQLKYTKCCGREPTLVAPE